MHGTSCPKSQLKSTFLAAKFGSLDHAETGEKIQNVISSVQHLISLIFVTTCFFYHTSTNDAYFVDKAYAEICDQFVYIAVFAILKN